MFYQNYIVKYSATFLAQPQAIKFV